MLTLVYTNYTDLGKGEERQMRSRALIGSTVALAACLAVAGWNAAAAGATTTCTWGGTPAAPTGWFTLSPGLTNTPTTGPVDFKAVGTLAGSAGCTGKLTYDGVFDTGSSCLTSTFHVRVKGLPGVVRAVGTADNLIPAPALLYDGNGNVVGTEAASIVTEANAPHYTDCTTAAGYTGGNFSSVVELF
jgi:hypothetical protein